MSTLMSLKVAQEVAASFTVLRFFPSGKEARVEIVDLLMAMCTHEEQAIWLRARVLAEWDEWEGPHELRALLCRRFNPKDQIIGYPRKPQLERGASDQPVSFATHLQYEVITGRDADGHLIEGVRRLEIAGPEPLALPPANIDTAAVKAESIALFQELVSKAKGLPAGRTLLRRPDKACERCGGKGWRLGGQLRCDCTLEPAKPAAPSKTLHGLAAEVGREVALLESELKAAEATASVKSAEQKAADLAELTAALQKLNPSFNPAAIPSVMIRKSSKKRAAVVSTVTVQ